MLSNLTALAHRETGYIASLSVKIIFGFLYSCSVRERKKISLEKSEHFPKIIPSCKFLLLYFSQEAKQAFPFPNMSLKGQKNRECF